MKTVLMSELCEQHIVTDIYGIAQRWDPPYTEWSFLEQPRREHGFMYVHSGFVILTDASGNAERYEPGTVLYIPKGCRYVAEFHRGTELYVDYLVNFILSERESGEEFCFSDRITPLVTGAQSRIVDDFLKIARCSHRIKNPYVQVHRLFFALLEKLQSFEALSFLDQKGAKVIAPALIYMDNHIGDNIPISDLSKLCLMSESAFRRTFREQTGLSPTQYKIHAKINKAKMLLQSSDELTVEEVSESLGFYDVSYFYKTFTALTGTTPKRFRQEK